MPRLLTLRFEEVTPPASPPVGASGLRHYYGLMLIHPTSPTDPSPAFTFFRSYDTAAEFNEVWSAYCAVENLWRDDLRGYVEMSLKNLESLFGEVQAQAGIAASIPRTARLIDDASPAIQSAVLTFAVSLRVFSDQLSTSLERIHGKNDPSTTEANSRISAVFDASFDYRVLYKLRNVLVHHSLRAVGLGAKHHIAQEHPDSGVALRLNRQAVYAAQDGLRAPEIRDLKAMKEDPDLLQMCRGATQAVREISRVTRDYAHPDLAANLETVLSLDQEFGQGSGDRAIVALKELPAFLGGTGPNELPHYPLDNRVFDMSREMSASTDG